MVGTTDALSPYIDTFVKFKNFQRIIQAKGDDETAADPVSTLAARTSYRFRLWSINLPLPANTLHLNEVT